MRVSVRLDGPRGKSAPGPVSLRYNSGTEASQDGSFQFDGLPPGRYAVDASSEKDAPFIAKAVEGVEVAPNGVAAVEIPLERLVTDHRPGRRRPDRQGRSRTSPWPATTWRA